MAGQNEPQLIKDIINKVITNLSSGSSGEPRLTREAIEKVWKQAVGGPASQRTRPTSLRKGRLVVNVGDSSLLYVLTLRKQEILESLARELNDKVKDIQFRIGETGGEKKSKGKTKSSKDRKG